MAKDLKIIIGCDACAYKTKAAVVKRLKEDGYDVMEAGAYDEDKGSYTEAVEPVCKGVQIGQYDRGILICGTGQGVNMAANKFKGIRSAICYDVYGAKMSRADNDANVLCTGAWVKDAETIVMVIEVWLVSDYYDMNKYGLNLMTELENQMKAK